MSGSQAVKKTPFVTYTVIGLCVLVYLWELNSYPAVEATLVNPIATGGVSALWTLFTMTLVHSRTQITHIVFNLMAFSVLGRLLETIYGSFRYGILLIALAWVASSAQIIFEHGIGIGLSGVVYGIFGFMIGASPNNPFLWWVVKKNAPMLIGWAVLCLVLTNALLAIGNGAPLVADVWNYLRSDLWLAPVPLCLHRVSRSHSCCSGRGAGTTDYSPGVRAKPAI